MAKVLSIEIGNSLTEIVEMDYKARNPKIYKSLMLSTPEGVLDEGMLCGYENFALALKNMLKNKGFKAKKAVFSVSSNRIASREVEIPSIKDNQIRDFVLANASEYFPVDITEYSISYSILEKLQNDEGGKAIRINALAVPTELIESYKEFAKAAGLEIEAIDYDGNSLYQAVKKECGVGSQIVIKIDEKNSIVTVMKDGVQSLTRTVPYGIEEAIDTIVYSHIYSDNTSHSEAISFLRSVKCINPAFDMEAYKKAKEQARERELEQARERELAQAEGLADVSDTNETNDTENSTEDNALSDIFGSSEDQNPIYDNTAIEAEQFPVEEEEELNPMMIELRENVTFSLENLVSGLSTVLDLYYSRSKGQKVDRVVITGIGGTIQGIDELITNTLDVPAMQISSLEGIQLGKVFKNGIFGEYIGCIGATISPVDFLVKEKKAQKTGTDITSIGRLVLIGCVGASVVMLAVSLPPYISANTSNKTLRSQLQSVVTIIPIYQKYTLSKQAYEFVNEAYSLKDEPTAHIVEFLEEMEEKMPADVLVSAMNGDDTSISITMSVSTKEEAADVYEQFCTFDSLESVTIDNITDETSDSGSGLITFTVVGVYGQNSTDDTQSTTDESNDTENITDDNNDTENSTEDINATDDITDEGNDTDNITNSENDTENSSSSDSNNSGDGTTDNE